MHGEEVRVMSDTDKFTIRLHKWDADFVLKAIKMAEYQIVDPKYKESIREIYRDVLNQIESQDPDCE